MWDDKLIQWCTITPNRLQQYKAVSRALTDKMLTKYVFTFGGYMVGHVKKHKVVGFHNKGMSGMMIVLLTNPIFLM